LIDDSIENERLPFELGWSRKVGSIGIQDILDLTGVMSRALYLTTGGNDTTTAAHLRRGLHFEL